MSAALRLRSTLRTARVRVMASAALITLPLAVATVALAWRIGGAAGAVAAGAVGAAVSLAVIAWRARRIDRAWIARALDSRRADMEDSAALLFADRSELSSLQRLQRERLRRRLADAPMPDLRPPWPRGSAAIAAGAALLVIAGALLWPDRGVDADGMRNVPVTAAGPGAPQLSAWRLRIQPPAYTGLEAHDAEGLETEAPDGSVLRWTLRFSPEPEAADLAFHDGEEIGLERGDEGWTASHALTRSALYRIVPAGLPDQPVPPLHRLEAIPDEPPTVRVLAPSRSLSLMERGQRQWSLSFEASDDYGVDATARLHLTLAQGTGENITFIERTRTLRGRGDPTRMRFDVDLDPVALGLAQGEDLVARLEVRDNRAPQPQSARSPSLILRWPPDPLPDVEGLDALARDVLPAYFRSQRQIIIDAEALLEEEPMLAPDRFLSRSDGLGVDQRVLRLRYGQFMGEEAEDGPGLPPTHAAEPAPTLLPIDDWGQQPSAPAPEEDDPGGADARAAMLDLHDHDHDHGQQPRDGAAFGSMEGVLEEYAHLHDLPEAATLLDPRTRETLRSALGEMWQSELALRQGDPARALPYAYRALGFIQQVREADRIYLARVGSQLPPIDESRRLGGDRDGIGRRPLAPSARPADSDAPGSAWSALADLPGGEEVDLEALEAWLAGNQARVEDPLSLVAAIDAVRNDSACRGCREALRARLWTLLERPPAQVQRRAGGDEAGARYLDALGTEDAP